MKIIENIKNLFRPPTNPKNEIHIKVNGEAVCGQKPKNIALDLGIREKLPVSAVCALWSVNVP